MQRHPRPLIKMGGVAVKAKVEGLVDKPGRPLRTWTQLS